MRMRSSEYFHEVKHWDVSFFKHASKWTYGVELNSEGLFVYLGHHSFIVVYR
jgi:hypothetical protein